MAVPADPVKLRGKQLREVGDAARELGKLVEHPSWPRLRSEIEKRKHGYLSKIAREMSSGGIDAAPVNQREIDYVRGFLRGVDAVLDTPERAIEILEKALKREEGTSG